MTGRERLLAVFKNKKPDRLPCTVHQWMGYYLKTYLNNMDSFQAFDYFDMDAQIFISPEYIYNEKDLSNWQEDYRELGKNKDGCVEWQRIITTPEGNLVEKGASNQFTPWTTEYIIKDEKDFEIWNKYVPLPERIDWGPVLYAKKRIGERGIVRHRVFDFGQASPWQTFASIMFGIERAIMTTYDNPEWMHYVLSNLLEKKLKVLQRTDRIEYDLVHTGGGAGSSTVISPKLHREFCLPYDKKQHEALHAAGAKVVYHLCGGLMPMLEIVAENGADGIETMTPSGMGGDCDIAEADRRIGDKLFFIGGFDQNAGFEKGNPKIIRKMVHELFEACQNGGYICSPSDHFFFGDPENIKAFVDAAKECIY